MFSLKKNQYKMTLKTVLITGSSRSLGKELAIIFAKAGFRVIVHGLEEKEVNDTKREISKFTECISITGNLRTASVLKQIDKAIKKYNIDIVVNNAGLLCPYKPLEKLTDAAIDEMIEVNLISAIKLTKYAYSFFRKKGTGTIININSRSGMALQKFRTIYSASKWGLKGFTDVFRLEASENNVRVIGVYPARLNKQNSHGRGLDVTVAAEKIFNFYVKSKKNDLILTEDR